MAAIPPRDTQTVAALYAAIAAAAEQAARPYLGMSEIGGPCDRALWFSFRWATSPIRDGRLLRLFRRGQLEEAQLAADLRLVGIEVVTHDEDGNQFGFRDHGGHFSGHMDGALFGILEAPKTWHVWECKTAGKAPFDKLKKNGVQSERPQHFAQMQCYMHYSGMKRAFYMAVCKDSDEIYAERVHYSEEDALALIDRARRIIVSDSPPDKIGGADHEACQWCEHRGLCHADMVALRSCRTCYASLPELDGDARWHCSKHQKDIDLELQRSGCDQYEAIQGLPHDDLIGRLFDKFDGKLIANRAPVEGEFFNDPVPF